MEFLAGLFAMIGSFLASIIGNILANDFCEFTPRMCRRLIERAVQVLSENDRARYSEEWLSHLEDCPGVSAKFKHACSCLLQAHKVAEARKLLPPFHILRVEYKDFGTFELDYVTAMVQMEFVAKCGPMLKWIILAAHQDMRPIQRIVLRGALVCLIMRFCFVCRKYEKFGSPNANKSKLFIEFITRAIVAKKVERTWYVDGRRVELADLGYFLPDSPVFIGFRLFGRFCRSQASDRAVVQSTEPQRVSALRAYHPPSLLIGRLPGTGTGSGSWHGPI
jgi:hypothetical protein